MNKKMDLIRKIDNKANDLYGFMSRHGEEGIVITADPIILDAARRYRELNTVIQELKKIINEEAK
jgi:hypothetical protein